MGIKLRSKSEVSKISKSGTYVYKILQETKGYIKTGLSTFEINEFADGLFGKYQVIPTFKGYQGFPGSICISINEEIVHGIPRKDKIIQEGDLISLDCGVTHDEYIGDSCISFIVGNQEDESYHRLLKLSEEALYIGIEQCKPGNRILDIAKAIDHFCSKNEVTSIRKYSGHGVGTKLHEDPRILHYIPDDNEKVLNHVIKEGMVFTIEPMITYCKDPHFTIQDDNWTAVTKDGSICSQFEHTITIVEDGYKILTKED